MTRRATPVKPSPSAFPRIGNRRLSESWSAPFRNRRRFSHSGVSCIGSFSPTFTPKAARLRRYSAPRRNIRVHTATTG